jgi:hypothetical protein
MRWKPPSRPDHPDYREILALIEAERRRDPVKAMAWFAAVAESDLWFFQKHVMPLGGLKINDTRNRYHGKLVVDVPWFFDRMREVQDDFDNKRSDVAYMWARGTFKTTAITQGGTMWILSKNHPSACTCGACPVPDTIAIFTHKVQQVGQAMVSLLTGQVKRNRVLADHWPQFRNPQASQGYSFTIDRGEGPKEPSVSVHPILASAASGHYSHIIVDDGVTEEIARSQNECRKVEEQLSYIQPLGKEGTCYIYVFTPYGEMDPMWKRVKSKKFFSRVSRQPAFNEHNEPVLYSAKYYAEKKRKMEEQFWESQFMLRIIPKGGASFRREWLRRYRMGMKEAGRGCRIHIIVDVAEGKPDSDYTTVRVYGFTADKKRRALDLWRENMGLTDTADLLFGVMPGDENLPGNEWKPAGGLVRFWQKIDPELDVSVEEVGATGFAETFRREMAHRKRMDPAAVWCTVRSLRSQRKKENRIAKLQPEYRNGAFEYPDDAVGFGHGSFTTNDTRDTLEQFIDDEYKLWTLSGETANDDMLDGEAWTVQPEVHFTYADPSTLEEIGGLMLDPAAFESGYAGGSAEVSWREASWRVC